MTSTRQKILQMLDESAKKFRLHYDGCEAEICSVAPGRVNLIGDHVDYNGGYVLPMAIPLQTVMIGRKNDENVIRIMSTSENVDEPRKIEIAVPSAENPLHPGKPKWANYVKGVIANFPGTICGFDALIDTSVPLGGGLSSSASLEVAVFTFLEELTSVYTNKKTKALACQKAEHEFANMPCGIMDQFVITHGKAGNAVLLDCLSLEARLIPLSDDNIVILVTNSNVRHELSGSEYPTRRKCCEEVAELLKKDCLRNANLDDVMTNKNQFSDEMFRYARHVVTEIQRTTDAADALCHKNYKLFGKLMVESHNSLRDDYKVSCPELDVLVSAALEVEGVYGSRMTGGGFGGCTVTLLDKSALEATIANIKAKFTGNPAFYVCTPSNGTHIIGMT